MATQVFECYGQTGTPPTLDISAYGGTAPVVSGILFAEASTNLGVYRYSHTGTLSGGHTGYNAADGTTWHFNLRNASDTFRGQFIPIDATIKTATDVETDTADIQSRLPAALVGGRMDVSVGAMAANVLTAAALAADAATEIAAAVETAILNEGDLSAVLEAIRLKIEESDDDLTTTLIANAVWASVTRTLTAATNLPSAGDIADAVWDEDATAHQTQGTFGQAIGDPVADANTIFKATVTDATGATVGADSASLLTNLAAVLTTQLTESYAVDGTAPTLAQAIFLIQQSLHEFAIVGTSRTVKKLDGTTTAAVFTLDSATAPTSTTRAS